jgi:GNAT superfamily N-acetyltransferase
MKMMPKVRALTAADRDSALHVINTAARWYREFLPEDELHDPEMTASDWDGESERMTWYGAFDDERLTGVAALEYIEDVALLRHAYILPGHQRRGIGSLLTRELEAVIEGVDRIIVGTYRGNFKARGVLEKLGYLECTNSDEVLRAYYSIPEERLRASLAYEKLR